MALPIIGGMVSQNVLNLVDTAMVGSLGDEALAAVGLGGFALFMATSFITGMSAGVQAMAARRRGEGRDSETAVPLNGGLLLALGLAVPWTLILLAAVPLLFPLLSDDAAVAASGAGYLQIRLLGVAAVGMNFAYRGYWNAVDRSSFYMRTLLVMHCANIFGNWVFIYGNLGAPALGVRGAALASMLSVYLGSASYFLLAWRHARPAGFLAGLPSTETLRTMLTVSVPAGIQQFSFAAGMTAFLYIVGTIGTPELAAANVLINLMLITVLPGIGFGLAAATLVGQALGRGRVDVARDAGWRVARLAAAVVALGVAPMVAMPDLVLGVFLQDPATLALARTPLRLAMVAAPVDIAGMVLMQSHLGAGNSRKVMAVSMSTQWLVFLPLAWLLGPLLGYGLVVVWLANVGYRALGAAMFAVSWHKEGWARVTV
jgi:MATE family multidrug resistance protein